MASFLFSTKLQAASLLGQLSVRAAVTVKDTVQKKLEEERKKNTPQSNLPSSPNEVKNIEELELAIDEFKENKASNSKSNRMVTPKKNVRSEFYVSDDDSTTL